MAKANIANTQVVPVESTVFPYYDDYNEDKNFYRILFRPGYAVQARELTQLQTIVQNQIERFGSHIFAEGSLVLGGQISTDTSNMITLASQYANADITIADFAGKVINQADGTKKARAKVIAIDSTEATAPVLAIKYLSGAEFANNDTIQVNNTTTNATISLVTNSIKGMTCQVREGIFFISGYFVKAPTQTIILDSNDQSPSCRIGLELQDDIITEDSDASLLDPAQESYNYQAPGATRYQVNLVLTKRALNDDSDTTKFIELLRLQDGIVQKVIKYPTYSEIENTLARRTYDESGDYTVDPFIIELKANTQNSSLFNIVLDPGKAYVKGYEFETVAPTRLSAEKARTTSLVDNYNLSVPGGNYIVVEKIRAKGNSFFNTSILEQADIHCVKHANVSTASANAYLSTKIGTTYIKNMVYDSSTYDQNSDSYRYKAYLFDTNFISLTSDGVFSNANSVIFKSNAYVLGSGASTRTYYINDMDGFEGEFKILYNVYEAPNEIRIYQGNNSAQTIIAYANALSGSISGTSAPTEAEILEHERLGGSRFVGALGKGPALGIDDPTRFGIIRVGNGPTMNRYKIEVIGSSPFEFSYSVRQNNSTQLIQLANLASAVATAKVSAVDNAYKDVPIRIYQGNAQGYKGTIVSYNGSTRTATVSPSFTGLLPNNSTKFALAFDETDIESIVTGTTNKNAVADISIASKVGGIDEGDSYIEDKSFSPLIFELPNVPVAANTIAEQQYAYNKLFSSVEFNSSGVAQISADTGEAFVGDGGLSNAEILDNYTIIVTNNRGSTNVSNGQLLSFTRSGYSITVDAGTGIANLTTSIPSSYIPNGFTTKVIAKQNINTGNKRREKTKTLVTGNTVQLLSYKSADGNFGASNTFVYLDDGQVYIRNPNKTSGQTDNLYISDVISVKVYESKSNVISSNTKFSNQGLSDVTSRYTLDNGQNDSFYDHAKLILNAGATPPAGAIVVVANYFKHELTPGVGYFSVDSYKSIDYGNIPIFRDKKNGNVYKLRDCIDFRPSRTNATNTESTFSLTGNRVPVPDSSFDLDYQYYLPRIDKLVLTRDRQFQILTGKPKKNPQEPNETIDDMLLYTLTIPAYTFNPKDIEIKFHENRRYTMRDIGQIDRRVKNLEYYALLSLLEKETTDRPILDNRGLERTKYGIIVDSFKGHGVGDVTNPDYKISIHKAANEMRPTHKTLNVDMEYEKSGTYADVNRENNVFTLKYSEEAFVVQPYATKNISVTDYLIAKFDGETFLSPESDIWHEDQMLPDVIVNLAGENDAWKTVNDALALIDDENNPFGKEWNSWETISTGTTLESSAKGAVTTTSTTQATGVHGKNGNQYITTDTKSVTTTNTYVTTTEQQRTGTKTTLSSEVVTQSLGAKVVDSSIIPYIRSRPINYLSHNLRPERRYYHWFDQTNIDGYIARPNEITINKLNNIKFRGLESGEGEQIVSAQNSAPLILVNGTTLYVGPENGDDYQNFDITSNTYFVSKLSTSNTDAATTTQRTESYTFNRNGTIFIFYNTYEALNSVEIYRSNGTVNISNTTPIFVANSTYTDGRAPNKAEIAAYLSIPYTGANIAPSKFIGPVGKGPELGITDQNRFGIFELDFDKSQGNTIHVVVGNRQNSRRGTPYQYAISLNKKESELLVPGKIITGSISGATANIVSINHFSGSARAMNASTAFATNKILLARTASTVDDYYVGNTIFIVSGQGAGQSALITNYNGTAQRATVNIAWSSIPSSNSIYSIGFNESNEDGDLPGTFFIPSNDDVRFRTGERIFKVTDSIQNDDEDATSKSTTIYHAMGLLNTKQTDVLSTRVPVINSKSIVDTKTQTSRFTTTKTDVISKKSRTWWDDPIAQTFSVPIQEYPQGLFLTSLDLYFARKDDKLPVTVQLRPTENGYPHSSIIHPHSTVKLRPDQVNISTVPNTASSGTKTTFKFKAPVYLPPGDHAFVVISNSAEYELWACEVGQTQIGTGARVSKQPYLGSSFRSQNSTTWTPFQYEDLMFGLNKAAFTLGTGTVILTNTKINTSKEFDGIYLTTEELKFDGTDISYELKTDQDSYFDIIPERTTIFQPSSGSYTRRKVGPDRGTMNVRVKMTTTSRDLSPVLDLDRVTIKAITNNINNGGIPDGIIKLKNKGSNYTSASVTISGGNGTGANAYPVLSNEGEIQGIVVDTAGSGYFGTPTITITGDGTDAEATIVSEETGVGGNMIARYITRKVTLADGFDAGDLKVYLDAYKPSGTDLAVYYKVLNSTDTTPFEQRPYIQMTQVGKDIRSVDESDFIEYEFVPSVSEGKIKYNPNDDQNQFKTFKYFAIKVVLTAKYSSIVPKVKNLRAMALPESD